MFLICVKAIIYLLLYNLHVCTFKRSFQRSFPWRRSCFKLFSNILEKYPWRSSFCSGVWLINEHQGHIILLFQLNKNFLLTTCGDCSPCLYLLNISTTEPDIPILMPSIAFKFVSNKLITLSLYYPNVVHRAPIDMDYGVLSRDLCIMKSSAYRLTNLYQIHVILRWWHHQ